jgi:beta-lactamase class A VEB
MIRNLTLSISAFFISLFSTAQFDELKSKIEELLNDKNATVGFTLIANNFQDTLCVNGDNHLPMQSVFKFPIALAMLAEIDKKKFTLDQKITVTKKDLLPDTWSPIRKEFPNGGVLTIAELIRYTVAGSDNNGCDILLRLIEGVKTVEAFLIKNGCNEIAVKFNEEEMHKDWDIQFQNWATANGLTQLLIKAYRNDLALSKKNHTFIWKVMEETSTGQKRLRDQLPKETYVAHKTGTSGANDAGVSAATNDIGVIKLPNGEAVFISILVSDSKESYETNEKIIADISKAVWDHYSIKE